MLLSPCHLAGIPLVIGFVSGREETTYRDTVLSSLLFAVGILLTLAVIGLVTALLGSVLGATGSWLTVAVGALVLALRAGPGRPPARAFPGIFRPAESRGAGPLPALLLGLVFGHALGP